MRVFEINECTCGSTGKISIAIKNIIEKNGGKAKLAVADSRTNRNTGYQDCIYIGNRLTRNINLIFSKITGYNSVLSIFATIKLIKEIKNFNPDILQLHNLHNSFLCLPLFFKYIKKSELKVVWTLHDCWAFTGECPHFTLEHCDKWINGCYKCPKYKEYPYSYVDNTKRMWKLKKKWFTGIKNLTIVTPSEWLSNLVNKSFLKSYDIRVINNGINLNIFNPKENDFRTKNNLQDKFVLLGVANPWNERKGLDIFIELAKKLDDRYKIVLVGTNEENDKVLPNNILSIHHTNNQQELAEIYSAADLFVNPTKEENFPTVNIESLACGTPVLTFDTGGSKEMLSNKCGIYVDCNNISQLIEGIKRLTVKNFNTEDCVNQALKYNEELKFLEYLNLYGEVNGKH